MEINGKDVDTPAIPIGFHQPAGTCSVISNLQNGATRDGDSNRTFIPLTYSHCCRAQLVLRRDSHCSLPWQLLPARTTLKWVLRFLLAQVRYIGRRIIDPAAPLDKAVALKVTFAG